MLASLLATASAASTPSTDQINVPLVGQPGNDDFGLPASYPTCTTCTWWSPVHRSYGHLETSMDAITTGAWAAYQQQQPYRALGAGQCAWPYQWYCYAHSINIRCGLQLRVYHNMPEWQWWPIMRLAAGQLNPQCVTAQWQGASRSVIDCCPCCAGCWEDPAHHVLGCRGLSDMRMQCPALPQVACQGSRRWRRGAHMHAAVSCSAL